MKKVLVLNASITGNALSAVTYLEGKRINETWNYINLNKELEGQLLSSESIGNFYGDAEKFINQLIEHDEIIIATPMINFNVSPIIEAWFAKIIIPGKTFAYAGDKYHAPLGDVFKNKKVTIIMTSGSAMHFYTESIKQVPNLIADRMKIIGFENISIHWISGTNMPNNAGKTIPQIIEEMKIQF